MERRTYQANDSKGAEKGKSEQQTYPEYVWVSYSDELNKKIEDERDNSILERSNRFAL
jgi:hypothetical protein